MGVIYRATARLIRLNNLVTPLVFGHYAWLKEWHRSDGEPIEVQVAGSGVFVAPNLGLGAKHVSKGFESLDDRIEATRRRRTIFSDQYAVAPAISHYAGLLYQAPRTRFPSDGDVLVWGALIDWPSPDTDIALLQVEPSSPAAKAAAQDGLSFVEWQLLPPEPGSHVDVYGFPNAKISVTSGVHAHHIDFRSESARVVRQFEVLQAHGFTEFAGFEVDRNLAHGFSGAPVFYNDRLVGIFSGPNYVSTLWPLLVHEYPHWADNPGLDLSNAGAIAQPLAMRKFADLLTDGTIRAVDFGEVEGRVRRVSCAEALEGSDVETRCDKQHVVLAR